MQELYSWRVLLGQLIHDPQERNRIANELGINPATLVRWAHNETNPRPQNLSQLLKVVASANRQKLQESIAEEFPEFGIKVNEDFIEDTSIEIPSGTYSSVLHTYITAPKRQRFWLVSNLILQEALRQLDPNLLGMTVSIAQCVKPQEGMKVRSLREHGRHRVKVHRWLLGAPRQRRSAAASGGRAPGGLGQAGYWGAGELEPFTPHGGTSGTSPIRLYCVTWMAVPWHVSHVQQALLT